MVRRSGSCSSRRRSSLFRDYRKLERLPLRDRRRRHRAARCCRACPGSGRRPTARTSAIRIPGLFIFQPAEFAKIAIVIFLASYLRDTRQLLVQGARRVARVTVPPLKHFGPLLVVWGAAMLMLVVIRDLGSSLMFFGGVPGHPLRGDRTGSSFVLIGLAAVRARRVVLRHPPSATCTTASTPGSTRSAAPLRQDRRLLPARPGPLRPGRRRAVRHRASARRCSRRRRAGAPARAADRPHLRGHHQRARPVRRPARSCSPTCCCRARVQDGDARPRLVLEAARHRPDGGVRAPGLRDRRRGDEGRSR